MKKLSRFIFKLFILFAILLLLVWIAVVRPTFNTKKSAAINNNSVSPDLLEAHVKKLSVDFLPRSYSNVDNLNKAADYIKNEFELIGLAVEEQKYTYLESEYKNLIVHLGPTNGPKIVIGAHYHVAGELPGADDNASGVAGLLELARQLRDKNIQKGLTLVAYTLEEPPVYRTEKMGSYVHAKSEYEKKTDIELMISLEMIGYYSDQEGSQTFPIKLLEYFYPTEGNYIAVIDILMSTWGKKVKQGLAKHMSLGVHSINAPRSIPGIDFSDHRSYWNFGYNAVMLSDSSFYRNKAYHTVNDTYDRLDYNKMSELINALSYYLQELTQK